MWIIPVLVVGGLILYLKNKSDTEKGVKNNPARKVLKQSGITKPTGRDVNPARHALQRAGIFSQDSEDDDKA